MSLTTDFLASPGVFMRSRAILIPSTLPSGGGAFRFDTNGTNSALLRQSTTGDKIPGYYAKPVPDNNNVFVLPTQQNEPYFMFTDQMNGCQFIAYGPDQQHITIEHNNFISNPSQYATRLAHIQAQHPAYLFHLTAGQHNDIVNGVYDLGRGVNIVGQYTKLGGWRFLVRDRLDLNQGTLYGPF